MSMKHLVDKTVEEVLDEIKKQVEKDNISIEKISNELSLLILICPKDDSRFDLLVNAWRFLNSARF